MRNNRSARDKSSLSVAGRATAPQAGMNRWRSPLSRNSKRATSTDHLIRELHGVTLVQILEYLVAHLGYASLGEQIKIGCFVTNPSIKSSLTFLRRTPWARAKVEELYIELRSREVRR
jgi:hypothetical protein